MRARLGIVATLVNAALTLAPQLVGLVALAPRDFGKFSVVYLLFAWGASLQLSIVCEPVARAGRDGLALTREHRAAGTWLALPIGVLAAVASQVAWGDLALTALSLVAVTAASFRIATRYAALLDGDWRGVLRTDVIGAVFFVVACAAAALASLSAPLVVLTAWATAGVGVALLGPRPVPSSPTALTTWISTRKAEIKPLLKDSLVLDASSIGTPYLLAPLLGFASFGIYRALSNVAAPVRLVIEPLRPAWAGMDATALHRVLRKVSLVIALPLGALTAVALLVVGELPWTVGVLTDLADWWVAAGIFVALSMVSHIYYIAARLHAPAADLWRGRLIQSGTAMVLPLAGAFVDGLRGALWAFVAATAIGALVWLRQAQLRQPPEAA